MNNSLYVTGSLDSLLLVYSYIVDKKFFFDQPIVYHRLRESDKYYKVVNKFKGDYV